MQQLKLNWNASNFFKTIYQNFNIFFLFLIFTTVRIEGLSEAFCVTPGVMMTFSLIFLHLYNFWELLAQFQHF